MDEDDPDCDPVGDAVDRGRRGTGTVRSASTRARARRICAVPTPTPTPGTWRSTTTRSSDPPLRGGLRTRRAVARADFDGVLPGLIPSALFLARRPPGRFWTRARALTRPCGGRRRARAGDRRHTPGRPGSAGTSGAGLGRRSRDSSGGRRRASDRGRPGKAQEGGTEAGQGGRRAASGCGSTNADIPATTAAAPDRYEPLVQAGPPLSLAEVGRDQAVVVCVRADPEPDHVVPRVLQAHDKRAQRDEDRSRGVDLLESEGSGGGATPREQLMSALPAAGSAQGAGEGRPKALRRARVHRSVGRADASVRAMSQGPHRRDLRAPPRSGGKERLPCAASSSFILSPYGRCQSVLLGLGQLRGRSTAILPAEHRQVNASFLPASTLPRLPRWGDTDRG